MIEVIIKEYNENSKLSREIINKYTLEDYLQVLNFQQNSHQQDIQQILNQKINELRGVSLN